MPLLQLISRQIGAQDISWGTGSFSYVDENGITRTLQQVNATFIPNAVTQDSGGNVIISGSITVSSETIQGTAPILAFYKTNNAVDNKWWTTETGTNYWAMKAMKDDWSAGVYGIFIYRVNATSTFVLIPGSIQIGSTGVGGLIQLVSSDGSHAGHIDIYRGDGVTRLGYIGYDNTNMSYTTDAAIKHVFSGGNVNLANLPAYTNNDTAKAAGLVAGDLYRIMHDPVTNCNPASVGVVY